MLWRTQRRGRSNDAGRLVMVNAFMISSTFRWVSGVIYREDQPETFDPER
jgi:hypothetical protein